SRVSFAGCSSPGPLKNAQPHSALRRPWLLPPNLAGRFVVAQRNEPGMPQMMFARPLQELDLSHEDRLQPPTILHLRRRQTRTPSAALRLRQIHERAILDFQPAEFLEQLFPHDRREPVSGPCSVDQTVTLVVSEDERA